MSHTIDDRIMELADEYTLNHSDEDYLSNMAMLNEFKQEMIDKACEWLKEHAKAFGYAEATDAWEATYKYDSKLLVEQFKKAMEK